MRCFITGGTGFIGQHLINKLIFLGYEVKLITRSSKSLFGSNVKCLIADLCTVDSQVLQDFIMDCDVVFHCAGIISNKSLMRSLHVDATKKLLDSVAAVVKNTGKDIRWVQLSSVGAYGGARPIASASRVVTELTNTSPVGEYEVTKTISDELILNNDIGDNFSYSILRPSNVYGKAMKNKSLQALVNAVASKKFFYIGPKGAISTYIHVDDVVDAMTLCAFKKEAKNELFNISADCNQELLIESIAKYLDVKSPCLRIPEVLVRYVIFFARMYPGFPLTSPRVNSLVARTHYDCSKIRDYLGFIPVKNIEKYINEIV